MIIKFSEEAQRIIKKAKLEMQKLKHTFIGSEHLLLSILSEKNTISDRLKEYNVNYDNFRNTLIDIIGIGESVNNYFIYTPLLKRILEEAILDAKEMKSSEVNLNTIFLAILDEGEGVAIRILYKLGVNVDKLYDEFCNQPTVKTIPKKLTINECSVDFTKKAKDMEFDPLIGREREVSELIEVLCRRNKNNPLLIGEAGVGKTAIVEELANRIVNDDVPDKLKNMRILSLSMASCVSGTKYRGEFEERITKIIKELETNKELIVFIDEIHTLVGAGGAEGAIDASNILKPALARGNIKVIGATTINEYKDTILKDKALSRRFQTILIKENSLLETKNILYKLKNIYEDYHHVSINNNIIDKIVDLSDKYIIDKKNPDKSLDILDTICTQVSLKKNNSMQKINNLKTLLRQTKKNKNDLIMHHHYNEALKVRNEELELESKINKLLLTLKRQKRRIISIKDVSKVISSKTSIPIYEIDNNFNQIKGLEKYLKKRIIGQDKAIELLSQGTKKIFMGFKSDLPYSFLFVGKSGVGKTMLVKEYSKYLNIPLIKLDMSEYKESHTISKIIGSPPGYVGYNDYDNVLEKIKNNPYSIILLDEIEKACSEVINLFLQILDEGVITDSHGNKVNVKNTIIIMTSNLGSNKENIGFNHSLYDDSEIKEVLSVAFINRINQIVYFNSLQEDNIKVIIQKKIKEMIKKYQEYNIKITINKQVINDLLKESEFILYGARKINRIIEDKMDNIVINALLSKQNKIVINSI